jgi:hypothetical protein
MSWLSPFHRARASRPRRPAPRRPRTPLGIETLEDRCVPATFNVNTLLDLPLTGANLTTGVIANSGGLVTLRSAISAANATPGGNTINLTLPGVYGLTLTGANEDNNQTGDLDILPSGGSLSILNTSGGTAVVDGGGIDRVFDINPANATAAAGTVVTFQGFTITGGRAVSPDPANNGPAGSGGGIRDTGNVSLTLNNVVLTGNTATNDGGGLEMENLVSTPWTLRVLNSTVSNNHAGDAGGGIDVDGHGHTIVTGSTITGNSTSNQGGGIWLDAVENNGVFETSSLAVTGSTFSDNITTNAGGVGGAIGQAGDGNPGGAVNGNVAGVVITSSTFVGNYTVGMGGAYGDQNGGSNLLVANSTFADNVSADNGGAIEAAGPQTTILDSTVTLNLVQGITTSGIGGGLFVTSPAFVLENTVVAGNLSNGPTATQFFQGNAPDLSGNPTTTGGDFIGIADGNTNLANGNGNFVGTAANPLLARLGPLQNNGGPVQTMLPLSGSPLIDQGATNLVLATDPITGQALTDPRGALRITAGKVDIGAAEFQNPATTITLNVTVGTSKASSAVAGQTLTFGQPVTLTATVAPTGTPQNNPAGGSVTFLSGTTVLGTAPLTGGVATLQVANLPRGTLQLTAKYSGDTNYTPNAATATVIVIAQTTIGAFDPTTATWFLNGQVGAGAPSAGQFVYGGKGWFGLVGDWQGNGQQTVAVVDPKTETWYIRFSNSAGGVDLTPFQFGAPGWIPVAGDWTGTGHFGIGVYDPTTATFHLRYEVGPGNADAGSFQYGMPGWTPVVGDWAHTGKFGVGVVDPRTETWYLRNTADAGGVSFTPFQFGAAGWKPVVGDWDGNGTWTVGVLDPSGKWYLRNSNNAGGVDFTVFAYGMGTWTPLAGQWQAPPAQHQDAPGEGPGAASIGESTLRATVQAALTRLADDGVSASVLQRLGSARYEVSALPAGVLGLTSGNTVRISADAAGYGWFVDPTPLQDEEFSGGVALAGSAAAGHEDLLTVVLHEMGHLAGLGDDSGTDLMARVLAPGVRHTDQIDAVFAAQA